MNSHQNYTVSKGAQIGDRVICHFYSRYLKDTFQVIIGTLTRIDDEYPSGSIDNIEYDFASEGHTTTLFKILEK